MSGCPYKSGQNVGDIKLKRRHSEDACYQRNKGSYDRRKARQKDTCRAKSGDKSVTALYNLWIPIQRPRTENLAMISLAKPEGHAIADNCSNRRSNKHCPGIRTSSRRKCTDCN